MKNRAQKRLKNLEIEEQKFFVRRMDLMHIQEWIGHKYTNRVRI